MFSTQCPTFCLISPEDLNYQIAKKRSVPKPHVTFQCKLCYEEFPGFHALRQHKNSQHGFQIKTTEVVPDDIINKVDDTCLKEELRSCQHFLVESELEKERQKEFKQAIDNFNAKTVNENPDQFFSYSKCAPKVILAFGFNLKNIEVGRYRYFHAHENKTMLDGSKPICIMKDLTSL